jgi:hypothetical protein
MKGQAFFKRWWVFTLTRAENTIQAAWQQFINIASLSTYVGRPIQAFELVPGASADRQKRAESHPPRNDIDTILKFAPNQCICAPAW